MSEAKCMRAGRITSNGYLNFLRDFRKKCCGMNAIETVVAGAKAWKRMTAAQRNKYRIAAARRPRRKSNNCKSRSRSKKPKASCQKVRSASCGRQKKKKKKRAKRLKPGPLTNNPFFNFMRFMRRHNRTLTSQEVLKLGARKWKQMSEGSKTRFRREACRASCSKRRKATKVCRDFRLAARRARRAKKKKMCETAP